MAEREVEEAIAAYREAVKLDPDHPWAKRLEALEKKRE